MAKRLSTIFLVLVFIVGLLIMLYPTISDWYNSRANSYVVSNYIKVVNNSSDDEYNLLLDNAQLYNENLLDTEFISGTPQDADYINSLNILNGMMGYLKIDKISVNLPIYHGTDESILQKYVGHLEGSSLPTGNVGNHTVITGHTGLPTAKLLTNLDDLEIKDTFDIIVLNKIFTYEVFDIIVVEPYEIDNLQANSKKDIVTLVTCTPYGINSHRLLVQGEQIDMKIIENFEITETTTEQSQKFNLLSYIPIIIISIIIIFLTILNIHVYIQNKSYRERQKIVKAEQKQREKERKQRIKNRRRPR